MKNKKLFIFLFACALVLSLGIINPTKVGAGTNDLTVSTLSSEIIDGDDLCNDDNICVIDIEEESIPLAVIKKSTNSKVRNLNSSELSKLKNNLIKVINTTRKKQAKNKTVSKLSTLEKTGSIRANEIVKKWSHTRPNGKTWVTVLTNYGISKKSLKAGENLAKVSLNAQASYTSSQLTQISNAIHKSLMNSATHKKVILNQNYKKIGIGIRSEVKDGKLKLYITEHFKN